MLKQIQLNFKKLFIEERAIALLFVVVQLLSIITIYFSYGIINHFDTKTEVAEGITTKYDFHQTEQCSNDNIYITSDEIHTLFEKLIPIIEHKIDYLFTIGFADGLGVTVSFGYEDDSPVLSSLLKRTIEKAIVSGRMFTEEELAAGERVLIAGQNVYPGQDTIILGGEEYKKIGVIDSEPNADSVFVSFRAIPSSYKGIYFSISLTKPLLQTEYDAMVSLIKECIGNKVPIPEFDGIQNSSFTRVYNDLIIVTTILIVVCAFNYCIIYRYILEKRRKNFAISRICGCTRFKATIIYMFELLSISLMTLGIGIFIYIKLLLPKAVAYFEYIEYYHTFTDNLQIALIYVACLFVMYLTLISRFVSTTPANLVRGCK